MDRAHEHEFLSRLCITSDDRLLSFAQGTPGERQTFGNLLRKMLEVAAESGTSRDRLVDLARESYDRHVVNGAFSGKRQW